MNFVQNHKILDHAVIRDYDITVTLHKRDVFSHIESSMPMLYDHRWCNHSIGCFDGSTILGHALSRGEIRSSNFVFFLLSEVPTSHLTFFARGYKE